MWRHKFVQHIQSLHVLQFVPEFGTDKGSEKPKQHLHPHGWVHNVKIFHVFLISV
jgi:hypothetical protein